MNSIDLNYAALVACVLNYKMTRKKAFKMMGIDETRVTERIKNDTHAIKIGDKENIIKLYHNDNQTMKQIALIYNTSIPTVQRYMLKMDIKIKAKGRKKGITYITK